MPGSLEIAAGSSSRYLALALSPSLTGNGTVRYKLILTFHRSIRIEPIVGHEC
jgi:hypothetical protein